MSILIVWEDLDLISLALLKRLGENIYLLMMMLEMRYSND